MWTTSVCNFRKTAQSKQSPGGRKFAQSGRYGCIQQGSSFIGAQEEVTRTWSGLKTSGSSWAHAL
jgi:hypothetical protein